MLANKQKKGKLTILLTVVIVGLVCACSAVGATLNVPGDYATIREAIDEASWGDTVYVAPGTYEIDEPESLEMKPGVILRSAEGPEVTTICGWAKCGCNVVTGADNSTITGFTITGSGSCAGPSYTDSAISCVSSSPTITNNIIAYNLQHGIYCKDSSPTITNNIFTANGGCSIYIYEDSSPTITNNTIANNYGYGIYRYKNTSPTITNNIITSNWFGIYSFLPELVPCTNYNNFWDNKGDYINCSAGPDDISADPMFVNPVVGDYHLKASSPCIDAGTNGAPALPSTDFDGNSRVVDGDGDLEAIVDMGAFEAIVGSTPEGNDVVVEPVDPVTGSTPVTLTFDNVTEGGVTTVTSTTPSEEQGAPQGFKFGNPPVMYEITTTADYTGSITVCFDYSGASYGNEANLKLYHRSNGGWVDITNPDDPPDNPNPDTENKIICGTVTSLSLFGNFELVDPVELLGELAGKVIGLNLQQGIETPLCNYLDQAAKHLDAGRVEKAIDRLENFIDKVEKDKKIPEADADALIADVLEIIDLLIAE